MDVVNIDITDTRNIYERIEAAKVNFPAILKTAKGQVGTRNYQYADITSVVDGVEPALTAEGVGIFGLIERGEVCVSLHITDSSAFNVSDTITCAIPLPADLTPQQVGSAITYYRRYALVLLLNLLTEDDDGAAASTSRITAPEAPERPVAPEAQGVTPVNLELPVGWDTLEQAQTAHKALAARIGALAPETQAQLREFRQTHVFPYSTTDFTELEEVVKVHEEFAGTVQA